MTKSLDKWIWETGNVKGQEKTKQQKSPSKDPTKRMLV